MHELARHTIHCSEMLLTASSVVESMSSRLQCHRSECSGDKIARTAGEFSFYLSILQSLLNRSRALEARLQNEINLVCS
jgi:hypothetical protein